MIHTATYFKFPGGIISVWEFQLEMTYTLSTLKESAAKQTMSETHTNAQAIQIYFLYAYYRKNNHPQALGGLRNKQQTVLEVSVNIFSHTHILSSKGSGFVGLAQEPG